MVMCCAAYGCNNRHSSKKKVSFHKFPLKNVKMLKIWMAAVMRENFVPSKHSVICGEHFTPDCFYPSVTGYKQLRESAFPTIFNYPEHLKKKIPKRKIEPIVPVEPVDLRKSPPTCPGTLTNMPAEHNYFDNDTTSEKYKLKYADLEAKNEALRKKLKACTNSIRRRDAKIARLEKAIKELKDKQKQLSEQGDMEILEEYFTGDSLTLNKMQLKAGGVKNPKKAEYSAELRQFAHTLHSHSPKAYRFLRKSFCLPSESCLRKWKSSAKGETECQDVFDDDILPLKEIEETFQPITQDPNVISQEQQVAEKRPQEQMVVEERLQDIQGIEENPNIDERTDVQQIIAEELQEVGAEEEQFFYLLLEQIATRQVTNA